ncbi:MAG: hypothetical protein AAB368_12090, partial [bacterium]
GGAQGGTVELLGGAETRIGSLRSIDVRYRWGGGRGAGLLQEEVYIPQREGHLKLVFKSLEQDASYYQPLFDRMKRSFTSLAPPPEGLAQ